MKENTLLKRLKRLSEEQIDKLAEAEGIGFLNTKGSIDKDDKIFILAMELEGKAIKLPKQLRKPRT